MGLLEKLFAFLALTSCLASKIRLETLSTLYLPYAIVNGNPQYRLGKLAIEQLAYDPVNKMVYAVGDDNIHVIDIKNVSAPTVVHHHPVRNMQLLDIEVCGDYILVAMDNAVMLQDGYITIYRKYDDVSGTLGQVHQILVGPSPGMIRTTADCRTTVVAIEGNPYYEKDRFFDPEGRIGLLTFETSDLKRSYTYKQLDFQLYNNRWRDLEAKGARFVFRGLDNTFAQDLEPEYIVFNAAQNRAYVGLQENNAIAVVDLTTENITDIYPLGFKNWFDSALDPSDQDSGIHIQRWPVFGMYQPDGLAMMSKDGTEYLVTANEGGAKKYKSIKWSEEAKVAALPLSPLVVPPNYHIAGVSDEFNLTQAIIDEMQMDKNLGRLEVSTLMGRNMETKSFDALYTFGGRGFSIWRADTMEQVYDSGAIIETIHKEFLPGIFNSDADNDETPSQTMDTRSNDKGPEVENVAVGHIGDVMVLFVGIERPGSIAVFSVENVKQPKFESIWTGVTASDGTWEELYNSRKVHALDPEDIRFVPGIDSPSGSPILLVAGAESGTLSILAVKGKGTSGVTPIKSAFATTVSVLLAVQVILMVM